MKHAFHLFFSLFHIKKIQKVFELHTLPGSPAYAVNPYDLDNKGCEMTLLFSETVVFLKAPDWTIKMG